MRKLITIIGLSLFLFLAACGNQGVLDEDDEFGGLATLDVEFNLPETADPGETVVLEAVVTYGDEIVEDADEVLFEYWLKGHEADSVKIEGTHVGDGVYTAEVTFDEEGVYEAYAHTTARGLHTMPLKSIAVGDVDEHDHETHADVEGFHIHFMNPGTVASGEETDLIVHLQKDGEAYGDANVRYEIVPEAGGDSESVDADAKAVGEYAASYTFREPGSYTIHIHVENEDAEEHVEHTVEVE